MTIKVLIDESNSTPEELQAFYQQPVIGKALDVISYHAVPNVELRVIATAGDYSSDEKILIEG